MKARLPGAGPRAEPNREMLIELLRLHAQALLRMPWILTCLVLAMALLMHAYIRPAVFLGWAVLTIGVEILRAQYGKWVLKRGHDINPTRTHVIFAALAALAGAATSASAVLFLAQLPLTLQCLLAVVLLAIPAAGTAVAQSSPYTLAAYALSILVPASLTWAYVHPEQ